MQRSIAEVLSGRVRALRRRLAGGAYQSHRRRWMLRWRL